MRFAKEEISDLGDARKIVNTIMNHYEKRTNEAESTDGEALQFSTTSLGNSVHQSVHQVGHDIKDFISSFTSLENQQRAAKALGRSVQSAARNLQDAGFAGVDRNGPLPAFQAVP